jgi:Flp pilus assembly pilin Flp
MVFEQLIRRIATMQPPQRFWRDRRAVTSVEYVVIALIITTAIVGGLSTIGSHLSVDFSNAGAEL